MKIVCAWCLKSLGEICPEQPGISHGICEDCAKKVKEERMSNRHTDEHCACGHRLRMPVELESGQCFRCLYLENEEDVLVPTEDGESFEWESKQNQRRRA